MPFKIKYTCKGKPDGYRITTRVAPGEVSVQWTHSPTFDQPLEFYQTNYQYYIVDPFWYNDEKLHFLSKR